MIAWLKRFFKKDETETRVPARSPEEAIALNAMRAIQTGKVVYGEYDGETLTNRTVDRDDYGMPG